MKLLTLVLLLVLASSASGEIYRWRDRGGVLHFSNSLDDVPLRYREKVTVMNYGPAPKGDAASAQAAPPAAPVVTQSPAAGTAPSQPGAGRTEAGRYMKGRRGGDRPAPVTRDDE